MPTYEYGCEACGEHWEMEQRISEDPIKKCPHCGKRKARRLISGGGGVIFKGGGWYADLYHKPKGGKETKELPADASGSSESSASDTKESEAKPVKSEKKTKKKKD